MANGFMAFHGYCYIYNMPTEIIFFLDGFSVLHVCTRFSLTATIVVCIFVCFYMICKMFSLSFLPFDICIVCLSCFVFIYYFIMASMLL